MTEAEFMEHIRKIENLLRHYAGRLESTRGVAADDTIQDALLHLWRLRDKAAKHPAPSRFFGQAGRWRMINFTAAERGRRVRALDDEGESPDFSALDPEPSDFAALVALAPEGFRPLLARRFADGRSGREVAAEMGTSSQAVDARTRRGLAHIKLALDRRGADA